MYEGLLETSIENKRSIEKKNVLISTEDKTLIVILCNTH